MDDQHAAPDAEEQRPDHPLKQPDETPTDSRNHEPEGASDARLSLAGRAKGEAEPEAAGAEPAALVEGAQAEAQAPAEPAQPGAEEAAAETPEAVTVQIDETGPCKRRVKVDVSADKVNEEIDRSYDELRRTVFIKGFRTGHVPRHILQRRFGDQVLESVRNGIVEEQFAKAVDDHALDLALAPDIDPDKFTLTPGQPFAFAVEVEVTPQFTIADYKGIEVERPAVAVSDDDVDQALETFRLRRGEHKTLQEGTLTEGDIALCHATALQDGEEIWRQEHLSALVSDGTLAGTTLPGLKAALLGAGVGHTKTLQVTLPDEFPEEEHRGKDVTLEVTIDAIRRFEAPEATDEWAESLNFDGLEDLREELYDELRRDREQQADDAVQDRIADHLLSLTDFDVPEGLVNRLVESTKDRQRLALLYRGVPRDDIEQRITADEAQTRDHSVRSCKLYFVYNKVAEQEQLFVTEDEVQARIQAIALNYRRRPQEIQAELEAEGRLPSLRQQMREEKVRDFLVQHAHVRDQGQAPPVAEEPAEPAAEPQPEPPAKPDAEPDADDAQPKKPGS